MSGGIFFNGGGGSAVTLGNLGKVLFVSETGSTTQTRADGLGRIDKPYSFQRAIDVAQAGDLIEVYSFTNLVDITINSKQSIKIIIKGNDYNANTSLAYRINSITISNSADISINSYSGVFNTYSCWVNYITLTNNTAGYINFNNITNVYGVTITHNTTAIVRASFEKCLVNAVYSTANNNFSLVLENGLTQWSFNFDINGGKYYIRNFFISKVYFIIRQGNVWIEKSYFRNQVNLFYFDNNTGSTGLTNIVMLHNYIYNRNPIYGGTFGANINLEISHCRLQNDITSGKIPSPFSMNTIGAVSHAFTI